MFGNKTGFAPKAFSVDQLISDVHISIGTYYLAYLLRMIFLSPAGFDVRLANRSFGIVEVKHLGMWGAVCAGQSWNDTTASIVCRQLRAGQGGLRLAYSLTISCNVLCHVRQPCVSDSLVMNTAWICVG